jgi:hypothetical protein
MRLLVDIEVPYAFDVPEVRRRIVDDVLAALDGMDNGALIVGKIRVTEIPETRLTEGETVEVGDEDDWKIALAVSVFALVALGLSLWGVSALY